MGAPQQGGKARDGVTRLAGAPPPALFGKRKVWGDPDDATDPVSKFLQEDTRTRCIFWFGTFVLSLALLNMACFVTFWIQNLGWYLHYGNTAHRTVWSLVLGSVALLCKIGQGVALFISVQQTKAQHMRRCACAIICTGASIFFLDLASNLLSPDANVFWTSIFTVIHLGGAIYPPIVLCAVAREISSWEKHFQNWKEANPGVEPVYPSDAGGYWDSYGYWVDNTNDWYNSNEWSSTDGGWGKDGEGWGKDSGYGKNGNNDGKNGKSGGGKGSNKGGKNTDPITGKGNDHHQNYGSTSAVKA